MKYRGIIFIDSFLDDVRGLVFKEFIGRKINAGFFETRVENMRTVIQMNRYALTSTRS